MMQLCQFKLSLVETLYVLDYVFLKTKIDIIGTSDDFRPLFKNCSPSVITPHQYHCYFSNWIQIMVGSEQCPF